MKKRILLPIVLTLLFSCSSDDNGNEGEFFEPQEINFIEVSQGSLVSTAMYDIEEENYLITTQSQWVTLTEIMESNNTSNNDFLEVEINFQTDQIIAIFDRTRSGIGWTVDVTEAIEEEFQISVTIENLNKGNLAQVSRRPYHIVKIPKSDKPVIFERIYLEDNF